jgi:hypothetical protein
LLQISFCFLIASTVFAQTAHQGLTPGISTRTDVERVFGQPVRSASDSLVEYSAKIYVQYGKSTGITDRIDVPFPSGTAREEIQRELKLPAEPAASHVNGKNKLEEYYGAPNWIILTYSATTVSPQAKAREKMSVGFCLITN